MTTPTTVIAKLSDLADRFDEIRVKKSFGQWSVIVIDGRAAYLYEAKELGRALTGLYEAHGLGREGQL